MRYRFIFAMKFTESNFRPKFANFGRISQISINQQDTKLHSKQAV